MSLKEKGQKCPRCGKVMKYTYEASFQEYPGAKVWPSYHSWDCDCGEHLSKQGGSIEGQENKRGW